MGTKLERLFCFRRAASLDVSTGLSFLLVVGNSAFRSMGTDRCLEKLSLRRGGVACASFVLALVFVLVCSVHCEDKEKSLGIRSGMTRLGSLC